MAKYRVTYGGWFQRTTLHLSEIYEFFSKGDSRLPLSKEKLKELFDSLNIEEVKREAGYLEYVYVKTRDGVEIKYYEDGLYVLYMHADDAILTSKFLEQYFEEIFNPAVSYIFSLGAPTPKILANIKSYHPVVVSLQEEKLNNFNFEPEKFGEIYSKITSAHFEVYKTRDYIFIVSDPKEKTITDDLVDMQIFFREFKDQLDKYLQIHRFIWEEISHIKEKKYINGSDVDRVRDELDSYEKTINLISNRINQMGSYVNTRASLSKSLKIDDDLSSLFQYKFEVLIDTLDYIKETWKMTKDYLNAAIQIIVEIKNQSASNNIKSLRAITAYGVVAGVIGYLTEDSLPEITSTGVIFFVGLLVVTWVINRFISEFNKRTNYKIKFNDRNKKI